MTFELKQSPHQTDAPPQLHPEIEEQRAAGNGRVSPPLVLTRNADVNAKVYDPPPALSKDQPPPITSFWGAAAHVLPQTVKTVASIPGPATAATIAVNGADAGIEAVKGTLNQFYGREDDAKENWTNMGMALTAAVPFAKWFSHLDFPALKAIVLNNINDWRRGDVIKRLGEIAREGKENSAEAFETLTEVASRVGDKQDYITYIYRAADELGRVENTAGRSVARNFLMQQLVRPHTQWETIQALCSHTNNVTHQGLHPEVIEIFAEVVHVNNSPTVRQHLLGLLAANQRDPVANAALKQTLTEARIVENAIYLVGIAKDNAMFDLLNTALYSSVIKVGDRAVLALIEMLDKHPHAGDLLRAYYPKSRHPQTEWIQKALALK